MHRCIVFAHYDRDQIIDDHVLFLLTQLRRFADRLIFVSVSATDEQLLRLKDLCDTAVSRENIGYDFMSWKRGLEYVNDIDSLDEILFVNDSIYGPTYDLSRLFLKAEELHCDFWGLTRCYDLRPHVQSFFFAFKKKLIQNGIFSAFWDTVVPLDDKWEIIARYEIGMTAFVEAHGGKCGYIFDQLKSTDKSRLTTALLNCNLGISRWSLLRKYLSGQLLNPMHAYWHSVVDGGVPFIKVELMRDNPLRLPLDKIYQYLEQSNYDPTLIKNHLQRISLKSAC